MKVLIFCFYLFCYFPYIKIFPKVDTQPTALLIGIIIFIVHFFKNSKFPKKLMGILVICLITLFFINFKDIYSSLRGILNYWSVLIISFVVYKTFNEKLLNEELSNKLLKFSINIWLISGLIEKFYDRYFFEGLISGIRTTATRGVNGLAPEPTFYGIMCVFFMIVIVETFENKKEKIIYIGNLLFQIFYLNQSSMTILFLGIYLGINFLKNLSIKKMIGSVLLFYLIDFIIVNLMQGTRVNELYTGFEGIRQIFYEDASLNQRAADIYYSLKGTLENYLLPNGFSKWKEYSFQQSLRKEYFYYFFPSNTGRIMSGFGGILYEMGILGLIYIFNYVDILYKGLKNKEIAIFILIIMFSAIQLSNPMIGIVLGITLVKKRSVNL